MNVKIWKTGKIKKDNMVENIAWEKYIVAVELEYENGRQKCEVYMICNYLKPA